MQNYSIALNDSLLSFGIIIKWPNSLMYPSYVWNGCSEESGRITKKMLVQIHFLNSCNCICWIKFSILLIEVLETQI